MSPIPACCPAPSAHEEEREGCRLEAAQRRLLGLSPEELDALVRRWLSARGLRAVCRWNPREIPATYGAVLDGGGFALPVHVRVFLRRNRLQPHHIESFQGHLHRAGAAAGILVSTGEPAPRALFATRGSGAPQLRLLAGADWLLDLARCGVRVPGALACGCTEFKKSRKGAACPGGPGKGARALL